MIYAIQSEELDRLIDGVSKIGEKKKSIELGEEPKYISLREAGRKYGEVVVKEWIKAGVVKRNKDYGKGNNSKCRLSVLELEAAALKCNVTKNLSPLANAEVREIISEYK